MLVMTVGAEGRESRVQRLVWSLQKVARHLASSSTVSLTM